MKDVRALHIIPGELVKPFRSSVPPRLAQSRVEMVEKLLAQLGTENSGFTLENVMTVNDTFIHMIPVAAAPGIQTQPVLRAKTGRSFSHISTFKPIHQI